MAALRDPEAWADVLADAWEIAAAMPKPDLRAALLRPRQDAWPQDRQVIDKVLRGRRVLPQSREEGPRDNRPGAVGRQWAGAARRADPLDPGPRRRPSPRRGCERALYRQLLGKAEGRVERWLPQAGRGGTPVPTPFGDESVTTNITFLDDEKTMAAAARFRLALGATTCSIHYQPRATAARSRSRSGRVAEMAFRAEVTRSRAKRCHTMGRPCSPPSTCPRFCSRSTS